MMLQVLFTLKIYYDSFLKRQRANRNNKGKGPRVFKYY